MNRRWQRGPGRAGFVFAFVAFAAPSCAGAQEGGSTVALDAEWLSDEIDSLMAEWTDPTSPGCAVGVTSGGRLIQSRGYGLADLEHGVPIAPTTVFNIASTSKQFTGMAIALLAERGEIDLDHDVRRHIPELPAFAGNVTLRHLLHHIGGLRDHFDLWPLLGRDIDGYMESDEVLAILSRAARPNDPPGTREIYNNGGYFLLAEVVERTTGRPLAEFARSEIFEPLGMERSLFRDNRSLVIPDRAESYWRTRAGFRTEVYGHEVVGYSDLYTTVEDLARWDANLRDDRLGRGRWSIVDTLLAPGRLNDGSVLDYGMGVRLSDYRGLPTIGHGGTMAGYRSYYLRFPEQDFAAIALCNWREASPFQITRRIADRALGDAFPEPPPDPSTEAVGGGRREAPPPTVTIPPDRMAEYVGAYYSSELRVVHDLVDVGGVLHVSIRGGAPTALRYEAPDQFRVGRMSWTFRRGPGGSVDGYVLDYSDVRELAFTKMAASAGAPASGASGGVGRALPAAADSVRLRYLHHSGWLVETPRQRLIFDYIGGDPDADGDPERGWLEPDDLTGKPLTIFVSHRHPDHFVPERLEHLLESGEATVIFGWEPEAGGTLAPDVTMGPRERRRIGELEVATVASTDLGVGFVVEVDGATLFHAGDHALWGASSEVSFKAEIDWAAQTVGSVDIAMMPIATGASCDARPLMREGIVYAVRRLDVATIIPMHVQCVDRLDLYADFARWFEGREQGISVLHAGAPGEWLDPGRRDRIDIEGRFEGALALLHSFDYEGARSRFREIRASAPDFAMAYWGEALTYTDPIGGAGTDVAAGRMVLRELGPTGEARLARGATERERGYLAAVEALFSAEAIGVGERYARFAAAMEAVRQRWPEDPEALAFLALGHLGSSGGGRDHEAYMRAAAVLEELFDRLPRHPGAAHYLIHAYDDPVHAPLGVRAARVYAGLAPDIPHALHMPSHIFVALGDWAGVIASNRDAWEASVELARDRGPGAYDDHSLFWLGYGLLQTGRIEEAARVMQELGDLARRTDAASAWFRLARMRAAWVADVPGQEAVAHVAVDTTRLQGTGKAIDRWARGTLAARAGDEPALESEVRAFEDAIATTGSDSRRRFLSVFARQLEAELALIHADTARAIEALRAAAEAEREQPIAFGPPFTPRLASEALGALLMATGRVSDGRAWLEEAERRAPNRWYGRTLASSPLRTDGRRLDASPPRQKRVWPDSR